MARFCPLFSGSSGNSTYIATYRGNLLVDVGVSFKRLQAALSELGANVEDISAVAVTHEHTDHIKGLKTFLKKHPVPVIASRETLETLVKNEVVPQGTTLIATEGEVAVEGLKIRRFSTCHDCEGSSGYVVTLPNEERVAVCTDLGVMTDSVREALKGCKLVLLESNHDIKMLQNGPYPPSLKMRILSENGHLSNLSCAEELKRLYENGTTHFVLGHLSEQNNLPMLALSGARAALLDCGAVREGQDYFLTVAKPCGNEVIYL